jgi:predicted RNA-binding Zn-ribbon protein involved in translation (DUF1610 family)
VRVRAFAVEPAVAADGAGAPPLNGISFDGHTMLSANNDERQAIVDYLASQAPDERVDLLQKVYTERLHDMTYDIWDVHTEKERWWVITNPTNLYLQSQFPNMDLALTFHVGLSLRIPRSGRHDIADLKVEPLLVAWRALDQAEEAITSAQENEDYQALGVRCRECLLSLIHALQTAIEPPTSVDLKHSDFLAWTEVIADVALAGASQKERRQLLKSSAKQSWQFVNWLTHARGSHFHDAEAALEATKQTLGLFTTACIRHLRGVPDACPACGSQRLAPERGHPSTKPNTVYERPICRACGWAGKPVEVRIESRVSRTKKPEGECAIMSVPLRGLKAPQPTQKVPSNKPLKQSVGRGRPPAA